MVVALLAVADGAYLTLVHVDYEVGKPGVSQVCHKLAAQGCSVTAGRFGDIAGIPIATIGMGGAMAIAVAAAVGIRRRYDAHDKWRAATYLLAMFSVAASAVMAVFSVVESSFCPFCLIWYGLNVVMLWVSGAAIGVSQDRDLRTLVSDTASTPALPLVGVMGLTIFAGLWYSGQRRDGLLSEREKFMLEVVGEVRAKPRVDIDLTGLPVRGPADAELTIVEIADFQCPFCRKVWDGVHAYAESSGKTIRTAFIHYPIDGKCNAGLGEVHEHACESARAAECARKHDKFWEMGDQMFAGQPKLAREDLVGYAEAIGLDKGEFIACLDDPATDIEIKKSIARAIVLDVEATPTFYVNGFEFVGSMPPPLYEPFFDAMLAADARE
jgi:protein-disulfide isomerase